MNTVTFETLWNKIGEASYFSPHNNLLEIYPRPFLNDPFPGAYEEKPTGGKEPKNFVHTVPEGFEQDKWSTPFGIFKSNEMKPAPFDTIPLVTFPSATDSYTVKCNAWQWREDGYTLNNHIILQHETVDNRYVEL